MEKREQIKAWFEIRKPKMKIALLIIGGVASFIGLMGLTANTGVGLFFLISGLILVGIALLVFFSAKAKYETRPSDAQMDQWFTEDLQEIIDKNPIEKLGVDKSELVAESLVVPGPVYWPMTGFNTSEILRALGKDNFYRYNVWTLQVFIFTEHYLGSYKCNYNWMRNTCINEATNEIFYKDVVSVKTDSESSAYTLLDNKRMEHAQAFQLTLAGDKITVITNDANLKTSTEMTSRVDKAIQSIRTMIRQKKSS